MKIYYLVSEPSYHTAKWFSEDLLVIKIKKKNKSKNEKASIQGLSILAISKTLMYEFWYDYIKSKYQIDGKLCYMDTESFVTSIKTEDFEDNADDVENRFDTFDLIQIMKSIDHCL